MKTSTHKRDNNEVQAARGRLRGALNDSLQNQEVDDIPEDYEEEEEEEEEEPQVVRHRQRGRPKKIQNTGRVSPSMGYLTPSKRRKREFGMASSQKIQAESFVMKLFDRSLDLSKYSEHTSLYPICRAWMANQPRNPSIRSYRDARSPSPTERKENGGEILIKLRKGEQVEVNSMPKPKPTDVPKIPAPIKPPKLFNRTDDIVANADKLKGGPKEEILAQHLARWKKTKTNWQKHTKVYQQRNEISFKIIQELFKP